MFLGNSGWENASAVSGNLAVTAGMSVGGTALPWWPDTGPLFIVHRLDGQAQDHVIFRHSLVWGRNLLLYLWPFPFMIGSVVSQFMDLWTAFFQRAYRNSLSSGLI